jgi:hypothetical protein
MTMMEVARDASGGCPDLRREPPPEIIDGPTLMGMLKIKLERGEITKEWYDLRISTLAGTSPTSAATASFMRPPISPSSGPCGSM